MGYRRNILVTGGCGFIGSHLVRHFIRNHPDYRIINIDKLTYCGDLSNLDDVKDEPNYMFHRCDIRDTGFLNGIVETYEKAGIIIDGVIHLAAESHVDRSIANPLEFVETNVLGTVSLLHVMNSLWERHGYEGKRFYHVSTDEVYGALKPYGENGGHEFFTEDMKYDPHSPYSASKASSDHFVRAYHDTYGMPVVISNCSNNYGPNQYPEKLIPLFIRNIIDRKPLPVYGEGMNVRDWLYVGDHVRAIDLIFHEGKDGGTYNIGGNTEKTNMEMVRTLIRLTDERLGRDESSECLITHVPDRKGHDMRYAIDSSRLRTELGWLPETDFEEGIAKTVDWYVKRYTEGR